MIVRIRVFSIVMLLLSLYTPSATALTAEEFSRICRSAPGDCGDHPVLQAYVGGALDLLATLDEETDYLQKLYCKDPKVLFDVPTIIHFIQQRAEQYTQRNAMLLVVRYFEQNGGCEL